MGTPGCTNRRQDEALASPALCAADRAAGDAHGRQWHRSDFVDACWERLGATVGAELQAHVVDMERQPTDPLPVLHLAQMCRWYGHLDLWRRAIDVALSMPHRSHEQLLARADAKLMLADWSGWRDREARVLNPDLRYYQSDAVRQLRASARRWNGTEDLRDKALLVVADGGFGDCIQMLRYVPWISRSARSAVLAVQPQLVSFVQHNFGRLVTVVAHDCWHDAPFDRYAWVMSLPALHGELPQFEPLSAPVPASFGTRPAVDQPLRVGLCWAGSPLNQMDHHQPLLLARLTSLFAHRDLAWFSLQSGHRAAELAEYPVVIPPRVPLSTFADTANLIAGMDAVVTVDTSVAHLAGSLGVPTLLMLHVASDPRWGLESTTPWYPAMRLIRQHTPGDWDGAIKHLARQLDRLLTVRRCT